MCMYDVYMYVSIIDSSWLAVAASYSVNVDDDRLAAV